MDSEVVDYPYGFVLDQSLDLKCITECYSETEFNRNQSAYNNMICIEDEVPSEYKNAEEGSDEFDDYDTLFGSGEGPCNFKFKSYTVGYYCIISLDATFPSISGFSYTNMTVSEVVSEDISDSTASGVMMEFIQDLVLCRNAIFGFGFAIALFVAFLYTKLLSWGMVTCLVWVCIFLVFILLAASGGFFYQTYQEWDEKSETEPKAHKDYEITGMEYMSYTMWGLMGIWVCFICCIRSKIALACAFVQIAGNAVRDMPIVCVFPVLQV